MKSSKQETMEKLDKHIKENLEARRIAPSEEAWQRISSQIGNQQKSFKNRKWVYTAAASLIGIMMVSFFFFQSEEETSPLIVVQEDHSMQESMPAKTDKVLLVEKQTSVLENSTAETSKKVPESVVIHENSDFQVNPMDSVVKKPIKETFFEASEILIVQKVD